MDNSIQQFLSVGIEKIVEIFNKGYEDPQDIYSVITGVFKEMDTLAMNILADYIRSVDRAIFEDRLRKKHYKSEGFEDRTLITSRGEIRFRARWYTDKDTNQSICLLEKALGLQKDERVTEEAQVKVLERCAEHSYRESGCLSDINEQLLSKQTVKNLIHSLEFPKAEKAKQKKEVEYLYIDADEDHIARQFIEEKGDLPVDSLGRKINTMLGKMVYIYEGVEPETIKTKKPESVRYRLKYPYNFCGLYEGTEGNNELWDEVYTYIEEHYDLEKVRKIYLNADGGGWIETGKWRFGKKLETALDGFHLTKAIHGMTHQMMDSAGEAGRRIREKIRDNDLEGFTRLAEELKGYCETESQKENVSEAARYIQNNWAGARTRLRAKMIEESHCVGSSTEAHVYHILSRRMSTLPMAWSREGADQMCHLRAYYKNGGDMRKLIQFTREQIQLKKAAGAETDPIPDKICLKEVLKGTTAANPDRRYLEQWKGSLSRDIKKKFWFANHYCL